MRRIFGALLIGFFIAQLSAAAAFTLPSGPCEQLNQTNIRSVHCYGAVGNGENDDTQAIKRALAAASADHIVYFPPGDYIIKETLNVSGKRVAGVLAAGKKSSIVVAADLSAPLKSVIMSDGRTVLENLKIDARKHASVGIYVVGTDDPMSTVRNCIVTGALYDGYYFDRIKNMELLRLIAEGNEGSGIKLKGSSLKGNDIELTYNKVNGLTAEGKSAEAIAYASESSDYLLATTPAGNSQLTHLNSVGNKANGVVLEGQLKGAYEYINVEGASNHGIWLKNVKDTTLSHSQVKGTPGTGNRAYKLDGNSSMCSLLANSVTTELGQEEAHLYATFHVSDSAEDNYFLANMYGGEDKSWLMSVASKGRNIALSGLAGYEDQKMTKGWLSYRDGKPNEGLTWRSGDFIINTNKTDELPFGWMCVKPAEDSVCNWKVLDQ